MGDEAKNKEAASASEAISKIANGFEESLKSIKESFELVLTTQNELSAKIETSLTELVKLTAQNAEQIKANADAEKASDDVLKQQVKANNEALLILATAQKASEEGHKKHVEATTEAFVILANAQKGFAEQCGVIIGKSNVEIASMVGNMKAQQQNRIDAEKDAKSKPGGDNYESVAEKFV